MQEVIRSSVILSAVIVALVNEYYQRKVNVPPMPSCKAVRNKMIDLIPDNVEGDIVELGSGWGGLAKKVSECFPNNKVIGYELSLFPFLLSKLKCLFFNNNLCFLRKDFFKVNLKNTSVVICYLSNPVMSSLKEKFISELPKGALIISSTFYLPDWKEEKKITVEGLWDTNIFLYRRS